MLLLVRLLRIVKINEFTIIITLFKFENFTKNDDKKVWSW